MAILAIAGGLAYAVTGTGLKQSNMSADYRLVGYWTEAGNMTFEEPFAIAVDPITGNVLVTDAQSARVVVFDRDGNFLREFGADLLENPTGIAVGPDGAIYVADYDLDQVHKFSGDGEFVSSWGTSGDGKEQFNSPNGLAVDAEGDVYIADFYNKAVKVFDLDGQFKKVIGRPGQWRRGQLDYPTDVDIAPDGTILVADAYNYRIQTFTPDGTARAAWGWHLLRVWPRPADETNGFNIPTGVAVSADGEFIHVADSGNRRVVMLDGEGRFVTEWRISEHGEGYHTPVGLATAIDGKTVYVTDIDNRRVIVLDVETRKGDTP